MSVSYNMGKTDDQMIRINVATSVSVFAMWNPPKHLTYPLVITFTFLHSQCFTWNFVTTSFIIPHSFWDGTLGRAAVVCDWVQPRCKLWSMGCTATEPDWAKCKMWLLLEQCHRWGGDQSLSAVLLSHPPSPRSLWLCVCINRIWVMLEHTHRC